MSLKQWKQCLLVCFLLFNIIESQINCTSINNDICTIDQNIPLNDNNRQNITCSQSQSQCDISCNTANSCSTNIICPLNGDLCTINCKTMESCSYSNIITGNCKNVYLNINGNTNNMKIYAPDNIGSLFVNIPKNIHFEENHIYSTSKTNNIIIECNGDCSENTINTFNINGDLNISCIDDTSICDENIIYCSNKCNIFCDHCRDTQIITNMVQEINDINWICNKDCSNSTLSDDQNTAQLSWKQCSSSWQLLDDGKCPILEDILNTITNTTSDPDSGDNFDQQFTILAFVLIGTVIGCLCVIVVTTIICCICWHEHQIKAINMKQVKQIKTGSDDFNPIKKNTNNNNNYNINNNNNNNKVIKDRKIIIKKANALPQEPTPSPPTNSEPSPNPYKVPRKVSNHQKIQNIQHIKGYKQTKSKSPESNQSNHSGSTPLTTSTTKKTMIYQQTAMDDEDEDGYDTNRKRRGSQKTKRETRRQSKGGHKKTGSRSTNTTSMNTSRNSYNNKPHSPQPPYNQNNNKNNKIDQKIPVKMKEKTIQKQQKRENKLVTFNENDEENGDEADDGLAPLKHDHFGDKYDEHGNYDKYKNRAQHKEEIKMALEAFPSNISAGTTGTSEMNFVGSNYRAYNPADQQNSYFKEEAGSTYGASDQLSLGNLDSGTTIASSIAMTQSTVTSPDFESNNQYGAHHQYGHANHQQQQYQQQQYQQQQQQHQGYNQQQHHHQQQQQQQQQYHQHQNAQRRKRGKQPNNIKIITPQNQGKVKRKHPKGHHQKNEDGDDQSPTLTYTSGNDPPMPHEIGPANNENHENQNTYYQNKKY